MLCSQSFSALHSLLLLLWCLLVAGMCFVVILATSSFFCRSSVLLGISIPSCSPNNTFSALQLLFFCPQCYKKPETRKRILVIFLCRFSTALFPGWNCSFPQHSSVASCIFVLCSFRVLTWRGCSGRWGGLWGGTALSAQSGPPEKCRIVRIEDLTMGNRLPDSHHGLHKYYFHLAWPFIVLEKWLKILKSCIVFFWKQK